MRSILGGMLEFGDVAIPVALASSSTDGRAGFVTLHRDTAADGAGDERIACGLPAQQTLVCPTHGDLGEEELVKGWEVAKGQYVVVERHELAAIAPRESRSIDVYATVPADAITPAHIRRTYYLVPSEQPLFRRAYLALAVAFARTGRVALARFTGWGVEQLAAIRGHDPASVLLLQTLNPAEDVVSADPILDALAEIEVSENEISLAAELTRRLLFTELEPALLTNLHRQRVRELVDAKLAGKEIVVPERGGNEPEQPALLPVDLEAALRSSIRSAPRTKRDRRARALQV